MDFPPNFSLAAWSLFVVVMTLGVQMVFRLCRMSSSLPHIDHPDAVMGGFQPRPHLGAPGVVSRKP